MINLDTLILLGVALTNALTAWIAWKTKQDVAVVKHETNSMKDALVAASRAEGREEGRNEKK